MSFGADYASAYDAFYAEKEYEAEAEALAQIFGEYGVQPGSQILDLGCGTGKHMEVLHHYGYRVVGVDASKDMLAEARRRLGPEADLVDLTEFVPSDWPFAAAYSLFDVLSYQTTTKQAMAYFQTLCDGVDRGGVVLVDAWHLPGVILDPPEPRVREVRPTPASKLTRRMEPRVDWLRSLVELTVTVTLSDAAGETRNYSERHAMRAYTRLEMELLARASGFEPLAFKADLLNSKEVTTDDWHILMIAERRN